MEKNKKGHPAERLSLQNAAFSTEDFNKIKNHKQNKEEEVHFHSNLINNNVGKLDTTI